MAAAAQPFGERIVDRYAVYDQIAAGGMAVVHLGRLLGQAGFSRTVAIKRLHPQFALDPDFVAMFLDEARLAVRIQHPNVVSPLDVLVEDGELLVVMEYISGETLAGLLRSGPPGAPVPPHILGSVLTDTLYGLHAAHEAKAEDGGPLAIVHRDVSPHNIIVGVDGVARVLDFGVAKAAMRSHVTKDGEVKGKIAYMAPEQLRAQPLDRRADVFAAGIVLWEALTGARLFRGDDLGQTVEKVLHREVPTPSTLVAGIRPELDAVVHEALERDPARRFSTARDFAVALERATPIASPAEVAEWVRALGGSKLEQRIQRVAAIESHSSSRVRVAARSALDTPLGLRAIEIVEPSASQQRVQLSSGAELERANLPTARPGPALDESASARSATKRVRGGAALVLGLTALAALAWGLGSRAEPEEQSNPPAAAVSPAALAPLTPSSAIAQPLEAPRAIATTASAPQAESSGAVASPPRAPATRGANKGSRAPSTAGTQGPAKKAATLPRTSCTPPYTVDAKGIRRVKPECL